MRHSICWFLALATLLVSAGTVPVQARNGDKPQAQAQNDENDGTIISVGLFSPSEVQPGASFSLASAAHTTRDEVVPMVLEHRFPAELEVIAIQLPSAAANQRHTCQTHAQRVTCTGDVTSAVPLVVNLGVRMRADTPQNTVVEVRASAWSADGGHQAEESVQIRARGSPILPTATSLTSTPTPTHTAPRTATPRPTSVLTDDDESSTDDDKGSDDDASDDATGSSPSDDCEPNDTLATACVLPLDSDTGGSFGPYRFTENDQEDVYSINLGAAPAGLDLSVTLDAPVGLDLAATVAGSGTELARWNGSGPQQLATSGVPGWIVLTVMPPADWPDDGTYTLNIAPILPEARDPAPTSVADSEMEPLAPDAFENNWRYDVAPTIGINTVSDANFVCPEPGPGKCAGGDHDWYRVQVKQSVDYLFATFDLAPGVDTTLRVHRLREDGTLEDLGLVNDDFNPGGGLLSGLVWQADADSFVFVEVAPRTGGAQLQTEPSESGIVDSDIPDDSRYRFAAVLRDSPIGEQVTERVLEQANARAATPVPPPVAPPVPAGSPAPVEPPAPAAPAPPPPPPPPPPDTSSEVQSFTGRALVQRDTLAYTAANREGEVFGELFTGDRVTLQGTSQTSPQGETMLEIAYQDWPITAWVPASALRLTGTQSTLPTSTGVITGTTTVPPSTRTSPTPTPTEPVTVRPDTPPPAPVGEAPPPVEAVEVIVTVLRHHPDGDEEDALPLAQPILVQVVTPLDDVLAETQTNTNGQAVLTVDAAPDTALRMMVPALGRVVSIDRDNPTITLLLPAEEEDA